MRLYKYSDLINKQIKSIQETSEGDHQHLVIRFNNNDYVIISSISGYEESGLRTDVNIEVDQELKEILKDEI